MLYTVVRMEEFVWPRAGVGAAFFFLPKPPSPPLPPATTVPQPCFHGPYLNPYKKDKDRRKDKIRRFCLGGRIYSFPCRARPLAILPWTIFRIGRIPPFLSYVSSWCNSSFYLNPVHYVKFDVVDRAISLRRDRTCCRYAASAPSIPVIRRPPI